MSYRIVLWYFRSTCSQPPFLFELDSSGGLVSISFLRRNNVTAILTPKSNFFPHVHSETVCSFLLPLTHHVEKHLCLNKKERKKCLIIMIEENTNLCCSLFSLRLLTARSAVSHLIAFHSLSCHGKFFFFFLLLDA
jgi:hypothetical protein